MKILKLGSSGMLDHAVLIMVFVAIFAGTGTLLYTRIHADTACDVQTLSEGSSGQCVSDLQQMLNGQTAEQFLNSSYDYYGTGLNVNGQYQQLTTNQVGYFQSRFGVTGNGITDAGTWTKLCTATVKLSGKPLKKNDYSSLYISMVQAARSAAVNAKC